MEIKAFFINIYSNKKLLQRSDLFLGLKHQCLNRDHGLSYKKPGFETVFLDPLKLEAYWRNKDVWMKLYVGVLSLNTKCLLQNRFEKLQFSETPSFD